MIVHLSVDLIETLLHLVALLFEFLDGFVVLDVGDAVEVGFQVGKGLLCPFFLVFL